MSYWKRARSLGKTKTPRAAWVRSMRHVRFTPKSGHQNQEIKDVECGRLVAPQIRLRVAAPSHTESAKSGQV
jgi:hypothetical protein